MLVLGIDTATTRVSVALGEAGEVLGSISLAGGRRHAEQLAPAIRTLCNELHVRLDRVSAIGVGLGPGLFTGLRVGVTTAKIMSQVLRIPVVGISSLDLVAYPLRHSSRRVVVVLDARRHEVFDASYQPVPGGVQRLTDYQVRTPADLVADLAVEAGEMLLAGDGARRYRAELDVLEHAELAGPAFDAPSAVALVELATARAEREEFSPPWELRPLYLRQSDAEIAWGAR